jgi:hypothetical protein
MGTCMGIQNKSLISHNYSLDTDQKRVLRQVVLQKKSENAPKLTIESSSIYTRRRIDIEQN